MLEIITDIHNPKSKDNLDEFENNGTTHDKIYCGYHPLVIAKRDARTYYSQKKESNISHATKPGFV